MFFWCDIHRPTSYLMNEKQNRKLKSVADDAAACTPFDALCSSNIPMILRSPISNSFSLSELSIFCNWIGNSWIHWKLNTFVCHMTLHWIHWNTRFCTKKGFQRQMKPSNDLSFAIECKNILYTSREFFWYQNLLT